MQDNNKIKLVATDLDGTFLDNNKIISNQNLEMLHLLGKKEIVRVIATGRNLAKTREVIPDEIPFDYIVFSTGAGVYNWKTKKLLYRKNIEQETVNGIQKYLYNNNISFHLFRPVPDNHYCWFYRSENACAEFERYFEFHNSFSDELQRNQLIESGACQFLVILPNDLHKFETLKNEIESQHSGIRVVRTSSPLGTEYIWLEIFHADVSKGNGIQYLCDHLNIEHQDTMGIGNDYNDIDLLDFTHHSYIVDNAPEDLKKRYKRTKNNEEHGFSVSVQKHL